MKRSRQAPEQGWYRGAQVACRDWVPSHSPTHGSCSARPHPLRFLEIRSRAGTARMLLTTSSGGGPPCRRSLACWLRWSVRGLSTGYGVWSPRRPRMRCSPLLCVPREAYSRAMTSFVHLTSAKHSDHVRRTGIKASPAYAHPRAVFAMPVVPSFLHTHQWMRELRKWGRGPLVGIYFRVPDDEIVWVGRYNRVHQAMTAAEAAATIMRADGGALGYEVILTHAIAPAAIHRIRSLPRVVGWRHFPGAHGRRPCGCPGCVARGQFNAQRLREAWEGSQAAEAD